eukprot:643109-Pleurochrysis_carterae.AAC.4
MQKQHKKQGETLTIIAMLHHIQLLIAQLSSSSNRYQQEKRRHGQLLGARLDLKGPSTTTAALGGTVFGTSAVILRWRSQAVQAQAWDDAEHCRVALMENARSCAELGEANGKYDFLH